MAIKAKNIIIGGKVLTSIFDIKKQNQNKNFDEPSKYIEKKDGELIRNINIKSHYLKDMYDLENE